LLLLFDGTFQLENASDDCKILFDYVGARVRFQADLFWSKSSIGDPIVRLWLDTYQTARDFKRRGIVEIELT
jgi:hypothetical protein